MINLLSYVGMNLQSELCLWTMLGLLRTIFDATLFKVNANLKQVWQMEMPAELSMPAQRVLRTMVSGVMLVQCFTVYVYLASYIVLLYPVFLEERPTLVLPWLLLAAVRKLLCELTSLTLGLGACLLLGPARPPCIKFVVTKIASITPAFYMWMLVYSYYNTLKLASAFKTFPAVLQSSDHDYGLELAVRRRRTKSLQDEEQLRKKIVASFHYESGQQSKTISTCLKAAMSTRMVHTTDTDVEGSKTDFNMDILVPLSATSERLMSNVGSYEDWCGNEVMLPRDADRILEQFVLMLLRISAFIKIEGSDPAKLFSSASRARLPYGNMDCAHLSNEEAETPPQVANSKGKTASYLQEYPQIFMKKATDSLQRLNEQTFGTVMAVTNQVEGNIINEGVSRNHKLMDSTTSIEIKPLEIKSKISDKMLNTSDLLDNNIASTLEGTAGSLSPVSESRSRKYTKSKLDLTIEKQNEDEKLSIESGPDNKISTSDVKPGESTVAEVKSEQPATTPSVKSGQSVKNSNKKSEQITKK